MRTRIPFSIRIAAFFILFIFCLLSLIGLVLSFRFRTIIQTATHDNYLKIAESRSEQLGELIDKVQWSLALTSMWDGFYSSSDETIQNTMAIVDQSLPRGVQDALYVYPDGSVLSSKGARAHVSDRDYYKEIFKNNQSSYISEALVSRTSGEALIVFAQAIKNYEGKVIGALCFEIMLKDLSALIADIHVGKTGFGWITDANGVVLAHPNDSILMTKVGLSTVGSKTVDAESTASETTDVNSGATETVDVQSSATLSAMNELSKKQSEQESGFIKWKNAEKEETVTYYASIPNSPNWNLEISVTMNEINEPVNKGLSVLINVSILAAILALIVGYLIALSVVNPVKRIVKVFFSLTQGDADLTIQIPVKRKDELGDLTEYFNSFIAKLREIVSGLKMAQVELVSIGHILDTEAHTGESAAEELSKNVRNVIANVEIQSSIIESTSEKISQIVAEISNLDSGVATLASNVEEASASVMEMLKNSELVSDSMTKTAQEFEQLQESAEAGSEIQSIAEESINEITSRSEALAEANEVIASIASQTNLLAMNAAIEAAHAGDAGKGFAVVADEIRNLAETSSEQSRTISKYIENVQTAIKNVVTTTHQSGDAFSEVALKIKELSVLITKVNNAMFEQKVGSSQIMEALDNLSIVAIELRDGSTHMYRSTNEILTETAGLKKSSEEIHRVMAIADTTTSKVSLSAQNISESSTETGIAIERMEASIGKFKV